MRYTVTEQKCFMDWHLSVFHVLQYKYSFSLFGIKIIEDFSTVEQLKG